MSDTATLSPGVRTGSPTVLSVPLVAILAIWSWAIFSCLGFWRDLEQYSYGWFVPLLAGFFAWRRLTEAVSQGSLEPAASGWSRRTAVLVCALMVFPLEYLRLAIPASRPIVWLIVIVAIAFTLLVARSLGGRRLVKVLLFPTLFFLTAAPWFSAVESGATMGLMQVVASITAEMLHWFGIEAEQRGTTIALRAGLLGIEEACSGIRSLQSGLTYGLAVGEFFFLTRNIRIVLMGATILMAFLLNLSRTFILSYQVEQHGMQVLHKIHDQVGVVMSLILPVAVWAVGRLLASPACLARHNAVYKVDLRGWLQSLPKDIPKLRLSLVLGVLLFLPGHLYLLRQNFTMARQTAPFFQPSFEPGSGNESNSVPEQVWTALAPTSGGYVHRTDARLPMGVANGYNFFWEPRRDNYNILWHHPERCMTGAGWVAQGPSQDVPIVLNGVTNTWMAFRFKNPQGRVIQLWGAWRNGQPVVGNRSLSGWRAYASKLSLFSKGMSATEIVSCVIPYDDVEPSMDLAREVASFIFRDTRGIGSSSAPATGPEGSTEPAKVKESALIPARRPL